MSNNILFGIICYKEKYWETETFQTLLSSYKAFVSNTNKTITTLNIAVIDNTDINEWDQSNYKLSDTKIVIKYVHLNSNPGIAVAINQLFKIAELESFHSMVFLDQDTSLPLDFYNVYLQQYENNYDYSIAFPMVYSKNRLISPAKYRYYRSWLINGTLKSKLNLDYITAINSGLMVNCSFFKVNFGYNETLRLDFCDHEFLERLNFKNVIADILPISLEQNFSSDIHDKIKAINRYRLYLTDMRNYRKNKNIVIFSLFVDYPHLIKETLRYKSLDFFKMRFF
ncbi:glycosyltransferase [Rhizosphaericola mali]|uniref:Glycosyltransferase n=1 Tax=Rhizosphaericola mali TaxID=2545455 RepID=A0A5P2G6A9_9BACT|nr:glycosyltransferase [Rhizosphaericola mali]QES89310.1 glycosyltransferase [Rhizosphaericola mali]